ncbi:MAG TPA: NF038129 family PEP-CTERM protein [Bryocella sp.]|nr:NF038129 family PEP-CTERM protein [Bryocella sp.]
MKKLLVITSALLLTCAAAAAHADSVTYLVSVDTSSQNGNTGYIDLELNAGSLPAADVMATVSGFNGATPDSGDLFTLGTNGTLPGDVSFDNQTPNDYFEALTFGNSVSFLVTLSGPGVSPTGSISSDAGTDFQLEFLDPSQSSFLFTNDPNGPAAIIAIANDGSVSAEAQPGSAVAPTPEPATLSLVALGGVLMLAARRWRPRAA